MTIQFSSQVTVEEITKHSREDHSALFYEQDEIAQFREDAWLEECTDLPPVDDNAEEEDSIQSLSSQQESESAGVFASKTSGNASSSSLPAHLPLAQRLGLDDEEDSADSINSLGDEAQAKPRSAMVLGSPLMVVSLSASPLVVVKPEQTASRLSSISVSSSSSSTRKLSSFQDLLHKKQLRRGSTTSACNNNSNSSASRSNEECGKPLSERTLETEAESSSESTSVLPSPEPSPALFSRKKKFQLQDMACFQTFQALEQRQAQTKLQLTRMSPKPLLKHQDKEMTKPLLTEREAPVDEEKISLIENQKEADLLPEQQELVSEAPETSETYHENTRGEEESKRKSTKQKSSKSHRHRKRSSDVSKTKKKGTVKAKHSAEEADITHPDKSTKIQEDDDAEHAEFTFEGPLNDVNEDEGNPVKKPSSQRRRKRPSSKEPQGEKKKASSNASSSETHRRSTSNSSKSRTRKRSKSKSKRPSSSSDNGKVDLDRSLSEDVLDGCHQEGKQGKRKPSSFHSPKSNASCSKSAISSSKTKRGRSMTKSAVTESTKSSKEESVLPRRHGSKTTKKGKSRSLPSTSKGLLKDQKDLEESKAKEPQDLDDKNHLKECKVDTTNNRSSHSTRAWNEFWNESDWGDLDLVSKSTLESPMSKSKKKKQLPPPIYGMAKRNSCVEKASPNTPTTIEEVSEHSASLEIPFHANTGDNSKRSRSKSLPPIPKKNKSATRHLLKRVSNALKQKPSPSPRRQGPVRNDSLTISQLTSYSLLEDITAPPKCVDLPSCCLPKVPSSQQGSRRAGRRGQLQKSVSSGALARFQAGRRNSSKG